MASKKTSKGTVVNTKGLTAKNKAISKIKMITVFFGRPGVPATTEVAMRADTLPTIEHALTEGKIQLVSDKEGIVVKGSKPLADGTIMKLTDGLENGVTYWIMPGINSA